MINIDDRLLDELDAQEYYLASQIARHMGKDGTAWPSVNRLVKLTKWTKPTVLKVRERLFKKSIVSPEYRKADDGRDLATKYRLTTPLIGIFVTADKYQTPDEIGGKGDLPGGVKEINPGGKGDLPEVLTNEVLTNTPCSPPGDPTQPKDEKKSKSAEVREKAEKGLAFFNKITDRDLSSKEHIKAFERAIKRGATGEDIAHATYEQIISTWGDKEAIRKWLTPLTICRSANLTRLCDAWRFRSEAERSKLIRQIHGVGPRTSGYNPTGGASNEGYNLRKLIEKQNAPRYD